MRTDSGWNWTPSIGNVLWRIPIISSSSINQSNIGRNYGLLYTQGNSSFTSNNLISYAKVFLSGILQVEHFEEFISKIDFEILRQSAI